MKLITKNQIIKVWNGFILSLVFMPNASYATTLETVINKTTHYLQGGVARSLGVLSIIIAGYLCLVLQKFPKQHLMMFLVGMGLIFGATFLYSNLIG